MNEAFMDQLRDELRLAGAQPDDVTELARLAKKLRQLKYMQMANPGFPIRKKSRLNLKPYFAGAFILAILSLPIFLAQSAQPTSWLFPVQKLSDSVAVFVHPRYRADVMMKRSEQVNTLVANHADQHVILATINDYTSQAKAYKKLPRTSYAAMEYCETNLKQAAAQASPQVKQAIQASLVSLES